MTLQKLLKADETESPVTVLPKENHPQSKNSNNLYLSGRVSNGANPLTNAQNLELPTVCPNVLTKYGLLVI